MSSFTLQTSADPITCEEYINRKTFEFDDTWKILWILSGLFALIATLLSLHLILQHLLHYQLPRFQRPITRILLMVPVYSFCSAISFGYYKSFVYLNVIRDCYEGFVIASFYTLMCQYLAPNQQQQKSILSTKQPIRFPPPACCFLGHPSSRHFLNWTKAGVMQYVIVRMTTTFLSVYLEYQKLYCPESMSPHWGHFYTTIANGVSMGCAMFTLVTFYLAVHPDISRYRPVLQFLSVKFVIFFGFWQGFFIKLVVNSMWIQSASTSMAQLSTGLQSLFTCFEMAIASILHLWAFDHVQYQSMESNFQSNPMPFKMALWDSFYWLDIWNVLLFISLFISSRFSKSMRYAYYQMNGTMLNRRDSSLTDIQQQSPLMNDPPILHEQSMDDSIQPEEEDPLDPFFT